MNAAGILKKSLPLVKQTAAADGRTTENKSGRDDGARLRRVGGEQVFDRVARGA